MCSAQGLREAIKNGDTVAVKKLLSEVFTIFNAKSDLKNETKH
jgi:hypothetical protein